MIVLASASGSLGAKVPKDVQLVALNKKRVRLFGTAKATCSAQGKKTGYSIFQFKSFEFGSGYVQTVVATQFSSYCKRKQCHLAECKALSV